MARLLCRCRPLVLPLVGRGWYCVLPCHTDPPRLVSGTLAQPKCQRQGQRQGQGRPGQRQGQRQGQGQGQCQGQSQGGQG